ncbi:hypothetical protein VCRA2120O435_10409 [Vibrio crassostreae]|nr:hypothetical protein VCRA2113O420_210084 [Vibrio crassostreae]CAK2731275.1 hypothetical protein VCRA2128O451_10408 [Vibrio crassostreae]CAK3331345.1 hypothetical protein VCRA2120O433_10408 [Vibrio crassostreae]CAK3783249.1 hypothetical protein VCRA2120O435_10409 [Vibrio crassostreae]CAK3793021.1 hypothetical protein VCRA2121O440_10410 [Vibrio crassostreae]
MMVQITTVAGNAIKNHGQNCLYQGFTIKNISKKNKKKGL